MNQSEHLLEQEVQHVGRQIFQLMGEETPSIFKKDWWSGKVLDWCMRKPAFKGQMFRLVDVLPSLKTSRQVTEHIHEYFSGPGMEFPSAFRRTLLSSVNNVLLRPFVARQFRNNVRRMAQNFIIAATPEKALPLLEKIGNRGRSFTMDLLGEAVVSEAEALAYQKRYLELSDTIGSAITSWPMPNNGQKELQSSPLSISIKLSSLYSQMDPVNFPGSIATVKDRLRPIFRKAHDSGFFVTIDMEQYRFKSLILAVFKSLLEEEAFRELPRAGIVIQTYLKDSRRDLADLIAWATNRNRPITIRLVKGAYWDYEQVVARLNGWPIPVFLEKRETDAAFEEATRLCFESSPLIRPAIASHNVRSLAHAITYAHHLHLPPSAYEIQMLYGMAEPIKGAILRLGQSLCEYTPIGELLPGMSYLVRRLLENTSNESFLRLSLRHEAGMEELLQNPEPFQRSSIS